MSLCIDPEILYETLARGTVGARKRFAMKSRMLPLLAVATAFSAGLLPAQDAPPAGFTAVFNGKDLTGWRIPAGDNGHWKVVDGVIDYDAESESAADRALWTEKEYGDFTLRLDWRIKETPYTNPNVHIVKPDGTSKLDAAGKPVLMAVPDSDSGIYLRGLDKAQVNIWCWPVGSGEVYGYRTDKSMPASVRAGVTPKKLADKNIGEWNTFEITVKGTRLTVVLNGERVIEDADLPGLPARGRFALQHHGAKKDGKWSSPPALVQFRNVSVKEL
jgi:hypothetical protein